MTALQKVIKYIALAFAVFLSVSIIGGILGAISIFTGLSNNGVSKDMKGYTVPQNVTELRVDIKAADFVISSGETFSVESNIKNLTV